MVDEEETPGLPGESEELQRRLLEELLERQNLVLHYWGESCSMHFGTEDVRR